MDEQNIFMLNNNYAKIDLPENYYEFQEEIIHVIKRYNLSLSQCALLFKLTIEKMGNTPIKNL